MDELKEEIVFLDAELLDDDDDAPVGTLVNVVEEPKEDVANEPAAVEVQEQATEEAIPEQVEEPQEEQPQEEPVEEAAVEEQAPVQEELE